MIAKKQLMIVEDWLYWHLKIVNGLIEHEVYGESGEYSLDSKDYQFGIVGLN